MFQSPTFYFQSGIPCFSMFIFVESSVARIYFPLEVQALRAGLNEILPMPLEEILSFRPELKQMFGAEASCIQWTSLQSKSGRIEVHDASLRKPEELETGWLLNVDVG